MKEQSFRKYLGLLIEWGGYAVLAFYILGLLYNILGLLWKYG